MPVQLKLQKFWRQNKTLKVVPFSLNNKDKFNVKIDITQKIIENIDAILMNSLDSIEGTRDSLKFIRQFLQKLNQSSRISYYYLLGEFNEWYMKNISLKSQEIPDPTTIAYPKSTNS